MAEVRFLLCLLHGISYIMRGEADEVLLSNSERSRSGIAIGWGIVIEVSRVRSLSETGGTPS